MLAGSHLRHSTLSVPSGRTPYYASGEACAATSKNPPPWHATKAAEGRIGTSLSTSGRSQGSGGWRDCVGVSYLGIGDFGDNVILAPVMWNGKANIIEAQVVSKSPRASCSLPQDTAV